MRLPVVVLAMVIASRATAQSVDPPIMIFDGGADHVRGSIVIANPTLYPINYILEPKSFVIACGGDVAFGPVDTARLQLRLSAMSGRVAPRQHATIFYEVRTDSLPAWFAIVISFSAARPEPGLSIRLEIPHIVYLMQRDKVTISDVAITAATYDSMGRRLHVRVENTSAKLTRLSDLVAVSPSGRQYSIEACPVFPKSARDFDFAWPEAAPPTKVIAKFTGFSIDRPVAGGIMATSIACQGAR